MLLLGKEKLLTVDLNKELKPTLVAKNYLLSGKLINSDMLNQVVKPQKVSVSQAELNTLTSLPKTNFNFPLSKEARSACETLIKTNNKRGLPPLRSWVECILEYIYLQGPNI